MHTTARARQRPAAGLRHNRRPRIAALLLAIGALAATGFAQQQVGQDGRLFDANPQVGGGRVNTARPNPLPGLPGNYQASGNARFGQSLHSYSPISDPTAFRATLGSASLAPFRRDSVSSGDAYANRYGTGGGYYGGGYSGPGVGIGRMQPYYDPSETVATAGLLRSQPQAVPLTRGITPPRAPSGVDTGVGMVGAPGTRDPLDQRLDWRVSAQVDPNVATGQPSYRWQGSSSIFGMRPPTVTPPVRRVEDQMNQSSIVNPRAGVASAVRPATNLGPVGDERRPPGTARLGSPADLIASGRNPPASVVGAREVTPIGSPPGKPSTQAPGLVRTPTPLSPTRGADAVPTPKISDPSLLPGYDAFTDMRLALALVRDPTAAWFDDMKSSLRDNPAIGVQQQEIAQLQASEFIDRVLKAPLRTFVGPGASQLNNEMLKAESLMQIGQFYDAAGRYEAARTIDPNNPLPMLGKAHALLAAGEYYSAAIALIAGLERYPDVARFQIDLQPLIGGGEIVDIRRADILDRLKDSEDARLRFLLGYLEYHGGNRDSGMKNLERAAAEAEAGSIIADYPKLLRGEARPPVPKGIQQRKPSAPLPSGSIAPPGVVAPPAGPVPQGGGIPPAAPGMSAANPDNSRLNSAAGDFRGDVRGPGRAAPSNAASGAVPTHIPPAPQPTVANHVEPPRGLTSGAVMPPPILEIDPPRAVATEAQAPRPLAILPDGEEPAPSTGSSNLPGITDGMSPARDPRDPRDRPAATPSATPLSPGDDANADDGVLRPVGSHPYTGRIDRVGGTALGLPNPAANASRENGTHKPTSRPTSQPARPRPPTPSGDPELDIDAPRPAAPK